MTIQDLYEPLIARDLDAIPDAARTMCDSVGPDALFEAVARFAVLAYAPSQHAKHALLCCAAASDLAAWLGPAFVDVVIECAIYAAEARQPWSEPPIATPPPVAPDQPIGVDELRDAVRSGDRLRAERWLSSRLHASDLAGGYLGVAAEDLEDLGHKLIVSTAAWKLSARLGVPGRYVALRTGIWEMSAYHGPADGNGTRSSVPPERIGEAVRRLTEAAVSSEGEPVSTHAVFLADAALEAAAIAGNRNLAGEVVGSLFDGSKAEAGGRSVTQSGLSLPPPVYKLSRDCGAYLKAHAVTRRLEPMVPEGLRMAFLASVWRNLQEGPSLEAWSFA